MKLVIMTKSTFFVEEDKILATLFDEGMECLHIHKPGSSPMYSERLLSLLPEEYYRKIYVHDHFYLQSEYGLGGIHLDDAEAPVPTDCGGRKGCTIEDIDKIREARKKFDFVFLDHVFGSIAHPEQQAKYSMKELEEASDKGLLSKVYALGGIALENIHVAKELGFMGVVICNDLWNRFNITTQLDFKDILSHFDKLKRAVG